MSAKSTGSAHAIHVAHNRHVAYLKTPVAKALQKAAHKQRMQAKRDQRAG